MWPLSPTKFIQQRYFKMCNNTRLCMNNEVKKARHGRSEIPAIMIDYENMSDEGR
jgi:hypothetical protein